MCKVDGCLCVHWRRTVLSSVPLPLSAAKRERERERESERCFRHSVYASLSRAVILACDHASDRISNALNGRLEIRPVVIDDRNASVAQVSRLVRMKRYQWSLFFLLRCCTYSQSILFIRNYSVSLALYSVTTQDERIKIEMREIVPPA